MNILIVNAFDTNGGAAIAAYRLFSGLKSYGINIKFLVQKKTLSDPGIIEFKNTTLNLEQLLNKQYPNKTQTLFSSSIKDNKKLIEYIKNSNADIVHLHWITNSFISIEDLAKINKPIVWTLHDMWAFTGGCHYDEECSLYINNCSNCPILNSRINYDLSAINFKRKAQSYRLIDTLSIVGVSKWIADCAKKSKLLNACTIYNLPNPINTSLFKPYKKSLAKSELNLDTDKKIILYGAMNATDDPRKGYYHLKKALNHLDKNKYLFIMFGNSSTQNSSNTIYLNKIDNEKQLANIYNCADVMLVPSVQENLSNTIIESLSCGTPVVAFDIGGNSDMIEHKINGYLAKPFCSIDLANGLNWVLNNPNHEEIALNARSKVLTNFCEKKVIPKYIELYRCILNKNQPSVKQVDKTNLANLLAESVECYFSKNKNLNFSTQFNNFYNQLNKLTHNIIIYGNGTIGKTIKALIPEKIVGFVDIADKDNHPTKLKSLEFDYILISVLGREDEIINYLINELEINRDKIITLDI